MTFANSLDADHIWQNIRHGLEKIVWLFVGIPKLFFSSWKKYDDYKYTHKITLHAKSLYPFLRAIGKIIYKSFGEIFQDFEADCP